MKAASIHASYSMSWKRVQRNLMDYGFRPTFVKILSSVGHQIYYNRAYILYRADLRKISFPRTPDPLFVFRFLSPGETQYFAQILRMEEWLEKGLQPILERGGKCLAALDGDRVAGFNLVSFQNINLPVIAFTRKLRPSQAYSEQISVDRDYRGRNLGSTLRCELFRALSAGGIKYLYGGTDVNNRANLALCSKVGLKTIAEIRHIQILGIQRKLIHRRRK